jgi:hypothetical protein
MGTPRSTVPPTPSEKLTPAETAILDSFDHHVPSPDQAARINTMRWHCRALAGAVINMVPPSADRTAGLRQLHEAMMTINKAIVCEPRDGHRPQVPA